MLDDDSTCDGAPAVCHHDWRTLPRLVVLGSVGLWYRVRRAARPASGQHPETASTQDCVFVRAPLEVSVVFTKAGLPARSGSRRRMRFQATLIATPWIEGSTATKIPWKGVIMSTSARAVSHARAAAWRIPFSTWPGLGTCPLAPIGNSLSKPPNNGLQVVCRLRAASNLLIPQEAQPACGAGVEPFGPGAAAGAPRSSLGALALPQPPLAPQSHDPQLVSPLS